MSRRPLTHLIAGGQSPRVTPAAATAGLTVCAGIALLLVVAASSTFATADLASATLTPGAAVVDSSGASNGKAILFNGTSSGPTPAPIATPAPTHAPTPVPTPTSAPIAGGGVPARESLLHV